MIESNGPFLHCKKVRTSRQKTTAGQRASSARPEHGCEALPHERQPKINRDRFRKKIFAELLK
jgi:hypothetical protein